MAAPPFVLDANVELNLKAATKQAEKFGQRFSEIVAKAQSVRANPKLYAELNQNAKEFEKKQKEAIKKIADYEYAVEVRNANMIEKEQKRISENIKKLEKDLTSESLNFEARKRKQIQLEDAKRRDKALSLTTAQIEKEMKAIADSLDLTSRQIEKEMKAIADSLDSTARAYEEVAEWVKRSADNLERRAERAQKLGKSFQEFLSSGSEDFVKTLEGGLDRIASSLKGNLDIGSLMKGGLSSFGSGLAKAGDLVAGKIASSGMAAAGALSTAVIAATAGIGLIIGGLGMFASMMMDIDKEVKDLNKTTIATFGTRSAMGFGLKEYRHAVQDLNNTLGMSADEATGLFDALDSGGYSLAKLSRGAVDGADKTAKLVEKMQEVTATAKAIGIGVNEFSSQAAEFAQTFAASLEDVVGQFSRVGKMASEAGFSTRRFYSLVVQATSGQATLNTRIDQTAEILARMSKILGDKQAAEFMSGMSGAFKSASSTDLMKSAMIAGTGNVKEIAREELGTQSRTFLGSVSANQKTAGLRLAVSEAGLSEKLSVDVNNPEAFAQSLGELSTDERNRLIAAVTRMDSEMGRRLDDLTRLSENADGSLTELPEAMRTFSTGGIVKTYAAMAENFGFNLDNMNAIQRQAFANMSGLSEEQISQMQALARNGAGTWSTLEHMAKTTGEISEEQKEQMIKQYGAYVENGKIMDANGMELRNSFDYLTTATEAGLIEDTKPEDLALAYKAFDETVAIGDLLGNEIQNWLRSIYEQFGVPALGVLNDILGFLGVLDPDREAVKTRLNETSLRVREVSQQKVAAKKELDELNRSRRPLTPEETRRKSQIEDNLSSLTRDLEVLTQSQRTLSSGEGSAKDRLQKSYAISRERRKEKAEERIAKQLEAQYREGVVSSGITDPEDIESQMLAYREATAPLGGGPRRVSEQDLALANTPFVQLQTLVGAPSPSLTTALRTTTAAPTTPTTTGAPTPAPARTPAPVDAAPTASPTVAAAAIRDEGTRHDETTTAIEEAASTGATVTREEAAESRRQRQREAEANRKHLDKVLTKDVKLGNALARSNLPQAIVDAQVKQKLESLLYASGVSPDRVPDIVENYMTTGTLIGGRKDIAAAVATDPGLAAILNELGGRASTVMDSTARMRSRSVEDEGGTVGGLRGNPDRTLEDFIYRGDGVRGTIHPIDERDTFVGMKPGGAIDRAIGGGGGGGVTVNIYGGDERRVFDVVKRVLSTSGIGPTRVGARA